MTLSLLAFVRQLKLNQIDVFGVQHAISPPSQQCSAPTVREWVRFHPRITPIDTNFTWFAVLKMPEIFTAKYAN
ncbi:MAG TPA: hypothetical protein VGY56_15680 [Verrucomicrobiae bacterium]|nr:hypothetical protein [Verrucomicrobiae bacterium]